MHRRGSRDLPPPGRLVADDEGQRVQCHLCGTWWPKLGMHVRKKHGMAPDDYRAEFGLDRETPLVSPGSERSWPS